MTDEQRLNTLLVVDDEEVIHDLLDRIFAKTGIVLEHARSADRALEMIQKGYGAVLTDIRMPGMDGIQMLRRIKQIDPNLEVVIMTGYASMESAMKATRYGAMAYLPKPFEDSNYLIEQIQKALSLRKDQLAHEELYKAIASGQIDSLTVKGEHRVVPFFRESGKGLSQILMDTLNDGIVFLDYDGVISFANIRFTRTLNFTFMEVLGKVFTDFILPEDRSGFEIFVEKIMRQGKGEMKEIRLLSKTDVEIPIFLNGSPLKDSQGRFEGVVLATTDLSDYCIVQTRLEMLSRLVDQAQFEAILIVDRDGMITNCNQSTEKLLARKKGSLFGKSVDSFLRDKSGTPLKLSPFNLKEATLLELRVARPDGKTIPVEVSISAQATDDPNGQGLLFVRDITERKRLEGLKDEFLSTVSHELRTPLTIMKSHIENLKDGLLGPLAEKQAHTVGIVLQNVGRLARLINDLLDLSRLESGKTKVNLQSVSVASLITNVTHNFKNKFETQGIELTTEISENLPTLHTDPDQCVQVLTNLLSNALHFAKSKVVVRAASCVSRKEDKTQDASRITQCENDFVEIIVENDGPGIATEDQKKLFNKFEQIHRAEGGAGYKGTGLGLAICREIVEKLEGKIWVESEVGKGASFHFTLPQHQEEKT